MEFKTCSLVILGFLASLTLADDPASTLPVLYRVDQPTSNVVVFRGANVALARAAGLIKSPVFNYANDGSLGGGDGNAAGSASYVTPAPPPPPPPPTTTPPPPPPPPATTAAPLYRPPPPPPVVVTPAPVIVRAPAPSYGPAPVAYVEPEPAGPANYNWEYAVLDDRFNDFGHKETRDGYLATGKYYVNLPDGRVQIVTYTADANGYVPVVEYSGVAQYPEIVKPSYN